MSELRLLIRKEALKDLEIWLNQQYLEIEQEITKLKENKDDKANYNKMVHPELDGACYICGINPKDIEALIAEARIDELERLIGIGAAGDKYRTKAKHGFVTIEERIEQLKEQADV